MFRFIVLIFLFKLPRLIFTQELILVDSINIVADKCIINSNGDIYGVNEGESFLFRINSDGDVLKCKLFQRSSAQNLIQCFLFVFISQVQNVCFPIL